MKLVEIIKPDFIFEDERGMLAQLTNKPYAQVNAVFTKKGAVRGNRHYHKTTKEAFFIISGEVDVTLSLGQEEEICTFRSGDMFLIPENVRHTFDYKEDTYLVALYTSCVELEDGSKDIITD